MATNSEPYVGPRPFEEGDREVFFGRDQETNELVSLITAHPIVLLYAQSGAGKTSLVKAALNPRLVDEEKFEVLPTMRVREQATICAAPEKIANIYMFNALMSATHATKEQAGNNDDWNQFASISFTDFLKARKQPPRTSASVPTVAVFDQFEELFTLYPERWEERQVFFEQIRDALADDPLLRVLFSMREDFIAELDPYASCLPEKLRTRFRIERLNKRRALVAITQPLKAIASENGGRSFAPDVAEELIDNLLMIEVKTPQGIKRVKGKFVETLQLQVVCQTLWNSLAPADKLITQEHLANFGNVDKALSAFYENAIDKTTAATGVRSGVLRRWCESALITSAGTRAPVFRDEKETRGLANKAVDELERQSLLRMELRGGAKWYELTHDRFVEVIKQSNQKWLLALPGAKQILLHLEERAARWNENKRRPDDLLDDTDLTEADRWLNSSEALELELGSELRDFLSESRTAIETKRRHELEERSRIEEQAKTAGRFRVLSRALAVLSLLAVVASVLFVRQWLKANRLKLDAEAQTAQLTKINKELENTLDQNRKLTVTTEVLSRTKEVADAQNKLNSGDLKGAETSFNAIIKETGHDPLDYAIAHWGLGEVALKSTPPRYTNAIRHYDDALKQLGYDPQGRKLATVQTPADQASEYQDRAASYLREKGELYLLWGQHEELGDRSDTPDKYKGAMGFYRSAKSLGGPGLNQAIDGFNRAKKAYDDYDTRRLNNPFDEPAKKRQHAGFDRREISH